MEPLRIQLFGGFLLERGGVALPPIASRAGRSLFAHLVMNRGRPVQRDLLAEAFWPELPEGRSRRRLSHALWQIQDAISDEAVSHLHSTSDTLAFDIDSAHWLDVDEFDHNFDISEELDRLPGPTIDAALRTCVDLYRGDFLAGFFDDWVMVEQDHYRQRYVVTLRRLIDVTKAAGDYEEALAFARRLSHYEPLSEAVHQEVMRLCFLLGRTSEAVQQYDRVRSVLAEELGTEPSELTVDLYQKIVKRRRAGMHPAQKGEKPLPLVSRSDSPFVGREGERRSLVDFQERVLAGPGGVVLVEGEPGVGKTRLALEAAEDAQWRGFEVSWGRCKPGALRPFSPLVEILESLSPLRVEQLAEEVTPVWLAEALKVAPKLAERLGAASSVPLRPDEESTRMREALVSTLGALGKIAPHLVVVDDVHWADKDTLGVLTQLGPRLAGSRVLLLLLYRSEEARGDPQVWDVLRELDRSAGLGRVVLSPMSVFEIEEMVKRVLGVHRLDPAVAARLHTRTGGNALFTLETLLALRDQGLFEGGDDPAVVLERQITSSAVPVAPRVISIIDSRMSLLVTSVAEVFEVAAICGDPFELRLLEEVVELPRHAVLDAVAELLHRGLIIDLGNGRYRIAHDQVRQVVYGRIEPARLEGAHRRVAEAILDIWPEDVEAIGHHFREGHEPDRAATYLVKSGVRAVDLNAYVTASDHFRTALVEARLAGWAPLEVYGVLAHLEGVLNVLGARSEQAEAIEEMAGIADHLPHLAGDVERRRAWLAAHSGDTAAAETAAARSVVLERSQGDEGAVAASLVALGTSIRWSGRPLEAVPPLEEAVEAAAGDDRRRAEALTELSSTLVEVHMQERAFRHIGEALSIYLEWGDLRGQAELAGISARAHHQDGEKAQARIQYEIAIELCERVGYRHGVGVNLVNMSNVLQRTGHVAESLRGYDRAALIFAELGNRRGEAMVLVNAASARHTLLGDDSRAEADARRARQIFADIGDGAREAQCLEILAGVAGRRGHHDEARALLDESLRDLAGSGNVLLEGQHLRSLAIHHLERRDLVAFADTMTRADRLAATAGLHHLAVELASIKGLAATASGEVEVGLRLSREAVENLTAEVERPYLVHHRHSLAAEAAGIPGEAAAAAILARTDLQSWLVGLDDAELDRAKKAVPEHREIIERSLRFSPQTVEVLLPNADAPIGRPLRQGDLLEVSWTIEHPDDQRARGPIERRRTKLLRLLDEAAGEGASPTIDRLAAVLGVSPSTVGRDLAALRGAGYAVSTRGQEHAS